MTAWSIILEISRLVYFIIYRFSGHFLPPFLIEIKIYLSFSFNSAPEMFKKFIFRARQFLHTLEILRKAF